MPVRIVVGGVPNCGKSTLTASIYKEMQARGISVGIHELDVFENTLPCILGVESWDRRKKVKSGDWSNPRIAKAIGAFAGDKNHFVLGDLTGIIDDLLKKMVESAQVAIAIGKDQKSLQMWLDFFASKNIPVALKIISFLDASDIPQVSFQDVVFLGNLKKEVLKNRIIGSIVDRLLSLYKNAD